MIGHGSKLLRKMDEAISGLLSQRSIAEAAKFANISPKTLHRWLKLPVFQAPYREARHGVVRQAVGRMQHNTGAACIVMLQLMSDPKVDPAIRYKATAYILGYSLKTLEMDKMEEMESRLSELERLAKDAKAGGGKIN